ncbi:MAG: hypothetical protein MR019_01360 [Ruminococcus sp.]|nr:hypothetical protein [Ruminococcus sp.]MDY3894808.1 hypothetical protein [Candidatus Fimenecus sp.]
MPKNTENEKEIRKLAIENIRIEKAFKKATAKNYANGITEFDDSIFGELFNKEDELNAEIKAFVDDYRKAKDSKDKKQSDILNFAIKVKRKICS